MYLYLYIDTYTYIHIHIYICILPPPPPPPTPQGGGAVYTPITISLLPQLLPPPPPPPALPTPQGGGGWGGGGGRGLRVLGHIYIALYSLAMKMACQNLLLLDILHYHVYIAMHLSSSIKLKPFCELHLVLLEEHCATSCLVMAGCGAKAQLPCGGILIQVELPQNDLLDPCAETKCSNKKDFWLDVAEAFSKNVHSLTVQLPLGSKKLPSPSQTKVNSTETKKKLLSLHVLLVILGLFSKDLQWNLQKAVLVGFHLPTSTFSHMPTVPLSCSRLSSGQYERLGASGHPPLILHHSSRLNPKSSESLNPVPLLGNRKCISHGNDTTTFEKCLSYHSQLSAAKHQVLTWKSLCKTHVCVCRHPTFERFHTVN